MTRFIEAVNGVIWGAPMLTFFLFIGIYFTFKSGFFQISGVKKIYNTTLKTIFKKNETTEIITEAIREVETAVFTLLYLPAPNS